MSDDFVFEAPPREVRLCANPGCAKKLSILNKAALCFACQQGKPAAPREPHQLLGLRSSAARRERKPLTMCPHDCGRPRHSGWCAKAKLAASLRAKEVVAEIKLPAPQPIETHIPRRRTLHSFVVEKPISIDALPPLRKPKYRQSQHLELFTQLKALDSTQVMPLKFEDVKHSYYLVALLRKLADREGFTLHAARSDDNLTTFLRVTKGEE
jgi:hypothetical protein